MAAIHPRTRYALREAVRTIHEGSELALRRQHSNGSLPQSLAIGVTSAHRGDGKTTIAVALASSLAQDMRVEVTLLDADFHTHSIEAEYGLSGEVGFSELLNGASSLDDARHRFPNSSLSIVAAGSARVEAEGSARSDRAVALLDDMKATSRYLVADLPATLHASTAPSLARLCDGVIVVVRAGHTTRQDLDLTLERLSGANVLGVVLNRYQTRIPRIVERSLGLAR